MPKAASVHRFANVADKSTVPLAHFKAGNMRLNKWGKKIGGMSV